MKYFMQNHYPMPSSLSIQALSAAHVAASSPIAKCDRHGKLGYQSLRILPDLDVSRSIGHAASWCKQFAPSEQL